MPSQYDNQQDWRNGHQFAANYNMFQQMPYNQSHHQDVNSRDYSAIFDANYAIAHAQMAHAQMQQQHAQPASQGAIPKEEKPAEMSDNVWDKAAWSAHQQQQLSNESFESFAHQTSAHPHQGQQQYSKNYWAWSPHALKRALPCYNGVLINAQTI